MNQAGADPDQFAAPPPRRRFRWWKAALLFVVLVCVLGAAAFIERRPIAAFVVQAYLLKYGIHSSFTFDELTRGRFVAHVRAGWEMPEFSADSVDVSLTYSGLFSYL